MLIVRVVLVLTLSVICPFLLPSKTPPIKTKNRSAVAAWVRVATLTPTPSTSRS